MRFIPDYILDIRRLAYKREYDEVFSQIHDAMDCPDLLNKLQNKPGRKRS